MPDQPINDETVLAELDLPDYQLTLKLRQQDTECIAALRPKVTGMMLMEEDLRTVLADHGVVEGLLDDAIREFCAAASRGETLPEVLLAQGSLPRSQDGSVEFMFRPSSDQPDFHVDEQDHVDYRATRLFENVRKGQPIARVQPHVEEAGRTVTGRALPPERVQRVFVALGPGVARVGTTSEIVSTRDGRMVFEDSKLSVTDRLEVNAAVDLHVGHIDFIGHVAIAGDVLDGFNVTGGKSIEVMGTVGACQVVSGGDIKLNGGMAGNGRDSTIKCGAHLTANYLHDVAIECEGNLAVVSEMMRCRVRCNGILNVSGNLAGGEYLALNGIEVRTVGSELGVNTKLVAGVDYRIDTERMALEKEHEATTRRQQQLMRELAPLARNPKAIASSQRIKTKVADMLQEYEKIKNNCAELKARLDAMHSDERDKTNCKINVIEKMYHGTTIQLGHVIHRMNTDYAGPISIVKFSEEADFRILPMTPLSFNARQMELQHMAAKANAPAAAPKEKPSPPP